MSDMVDLSARRWDQEDNPAKHAPMDAIKAAVREIEADGAAHVIVCIAHEGENGAVSGSWYQAGSYTLHGQIGMLERIKADRQLGSAHLRAQRHRLQQVRNGANMNEQQLSVWAANHAMDLVKGNQIGFDQVPDLHRILLDLVRAPDPVEGVENNG
jgi:hypothetical protein